MASRARRRPGPLITRARLAAALGGHLPRPGQRIGLLGGSFNPPHEGHRAISLEALRRLDLDQVWWLVSPQNPLKSSRNTAPLAQRLAAAQDMARHPRCRATALESLLGSSYTADTLDCLARRFPGVRFVWLMGADNLLQMPAWQAWQQIFCTVNIAVFDRPTYSLRALAARAARRFARFRWPERRSRALTEQAPPAWVFIHNRLSHQSSTDLRAADHGSTSAGREERPPETRPGLAQATREER